MIRLPGPYLAAPCRAHKTKSSILALTVILLTLSAVSSFGASPSRGPEPTKRRIASPPSLSIDDVKHSEGNSGTTPFVFTVTLSELTTDEVKVDFKTVDAQATVANNDYVATSGTLVIPPSTSSGTITVLVNGDLTLESNEAFTVELSNPSSATIGDGVGVGLINNDDAQPSLSIGDVTLPEGNSGKTAFGFVVSLSNLTDQPVTVKYATAQGSATVANNDYQPTSGTLTIPPKTASGTITVSVNGDDVRESDETFFVNLSNPTNVTIADGQGKGTIQNDDGLPTLTISDVTLPEGDSGKTDFVFTVSLSNRTDQPVTVNFATADGSATEDNDDYQPAAGTLTIPAKAASGSVTVSVNGDDIEEADETFTVNLSSPVNAGIADGAGVGTIVNDDAEPSLSISDLAHLEGDAGKTAFAFTVSLSHPTDQPVTVVFSTADGSATVADNDYQPTSGTLTIPAKTVSGAVTVSVNGDDVVEGDETFFVDLAAAVNATIADNQGVGTILNDDVFLYIGDVEKAEGDAGKTDFVFGLLLSHSVSQAVTVDFTTADGSATEADNDYQPVSGTVTIPANTVSGTITVSVNGDLTPENNETFFVNLSNAVNATIADDQGAGIIRNDDAPTSVPPVGITEFALGSVRPNPSRGMTLMEITVPREAPVKLNVVDIQGREVATLIDGIYRPGRYQVTWNARSSRGDAPAGIYFIRYRVPGKEMVRRLILAR